MNTVFLGVRFISYIYPDQPIPVCPLRLLVKYGINNLLFQLMRFGSPGNIHQIGGKTGE